MKKGCVAIGEMLQLRKKLHMSSTWNVRNMLQTGKRQVIGKELERVGVDVCGLSEVRWKGQGHITTLEGHTVVYSGEKVQGQRDVAVW